MFRAVRVARRFAFFAFLVFLLTFLFTVKSDAPPPPVQAAPNHAITSVQITSFYTVGNVLWAWVDINGTANPGDICYHSEASPTGGGPWDFTNATFLNGPGSFQQLIGILTPTNVWFRITARPCAGGNSSIGGCLADFSGTSCRQTCIGNCPRPFQCGDSVIEAPEQCDPAGGTCSATCLWDNDQDGVPNNTDMCPSNVGTAPHGCPDTDGDGFHDGIDLCRTTPGTVNGCPLVACPSGDSDNDTVCNNVDQCIGNPGPPSNNGCPVPVPTIPTPPPVTVIPLPPDDGDGDDIHTDNKDGDNFTSDDKCPDYAGPNNGCHVDFPDDGQCYVVTDTADKNGDREADDVWLRAEPNDSAQAVDRLHWDSPTAYRVIGVQNEGDDQWWHVEIGSDPSSQGWVRDNLTIESPGCDSPVGLDIQQALTDAGCPEDFGLVRTWEPHIQYAIVGAEFPCNAFDTFNAAALPNYHPTANIVDSVTEIVGENCPALLPTLATLLDNLQGNHFGPLTDYREMFLASLNHESGTELCNQIRTLQNNLIPSVVNAVDVPEVSIRICNGQVITDERYSVLLGQLESLYTIDGKVDTEALANDLRQKPCDLVNAVNILGNLSGSMHGVYRLLRVCHDPLSAASLVAELVVAGYGDIPTTGLENIECSSLVSTITSSSNLTPRPIPDTEIPEELSSCEPRFQVSLFMQTHRPSLSNEQFSVILNSTDPCWSMRYYMLTGHLTQQIPTDPPIETPEPPQPPIETPEPTDIPTEPSVIAEPTDSNPDTIDQSITPTPTIEPTKIAGVPSGILDDDPSDTLFDYTSDDILVQASALLLTHAGKQLNLVKNGEIVTLVTSDGEIRWPVFWPNVEAIVYMEIIDNQPYVKAVGFDKRTGRFADLSGINVDVNSRIAVTTDDTLLVTMTDSDGQYGIFEVYIDSRIAPRLIIPDASNPAYAPSSKVLLFEQGIEGKHEIFFTSLADGVHPFSKTLNPPNEPNCVNPVIDPSSSYYYFECKNPDSGVTTIYKYGTTGDTTALAIEPTPIFLAPGPIEGYLGFSDGRRFYNYGLEGNVTIVFPDPSWIDPNLEMSSVAWR